MSDALVCAESDCRLDHGDHLKAQRVNPKIETEDHLQCMKKVCWDIENFSYFRKILADWIVVLK